MPPRRGRALPPGQPDLLGDAAQLLGLRHTRATQPFPLLDRSAAVART